MVFVLMAAIHEHTLIRLSIVKTVLFLHAWDVPTNPSSKNTRVPPLTKPPQEEPAVCTEHHHHHPPALALEPLALREAQEMAEFFAALSDTTRLRLISLLAVEECCVCDLAAQLGMTESAISHQLRTLRAARLVSYRKVGRQVFYQLHDHHVIALYRTVQEHLAE